MIAVLVLVVMLASIAYRAMFPGTFDSARWQSADSTADFLARREMLPDVNRLLAQRTIVDIETAQKLLGGPDRRDETSPPRTAWFYDLGDERGGTAPGPRQWLQLDFDESGRLLAHRVRVEQSPGTASTRPLAPAS
jgi:hypothetical protein